MTTTVTTIVPKARFRRLAENGGISAQWLNATIKEVIGDIGNLQDIYNNKLYPLIQVLPHTADDPTDAFDTGLDGRTIFTDVSATSSSDDLFYKDGRKQTVKESLLVLASRIAAVSGSVTTTTAPTSGQITSLQASDSQQLSYIDQLKTDVFGSAYGLDGSADLTHPLGKLVKALLDIHGGSSLFTEVSFSGSDVDVSHAGLTNDEPFGSMTIYPKDMSPPAVTHGTYDQTTLTTITVGANGFVMPAVKFDKTAGTPYAVLCAVTLPRDANNKHPTRFSAYATFTHVASEVGNTTTFELHPGEYSGDTDIAPAVNGSAINATSYDNNKASVAKSGGAGSTHEVVDFYPSGPATIDDVDNGVLYFIISRSATADGWAGDAYLLHVNVTFYGPVE